MPRKKKSRGNDNHRGSGHGRGHKHSRGGPKGVPTTVAGATGSANRGPRHPYPHTNTEFDVTIQRWEDPPIEPDTNGGGNVNRRYRPWNGGALNSGSGARTPSRGTDSPRRGGLTPRGAGAGRGRGRGRGRGLDRDNGGNYFGAPRRPHLSDATVGARARPRIARDAPLSDMLYAERPLLRPVKFVRATLTPFLFQNSEEVLEPASSQATDTMESSHTPPADRVARLSRTNMPDSDLEPEGHTQDALEEIDFADLAQVRAEVDAIAQGIATTEQNAYDNQEEIEEVDFAEMAAIRAKVDAANPREASREETTREAFTGVYNQIIQVAQTSSPIVSPTVDDPLDPMSSIRISKLSDESFSHARDIVAEEVPSSPITLPNVSTKEPSLPIAPERHPASSSTRNIPRRPDAPPYDDPHQLFFVDTTSTLPFTGSSASDAILVDRANHDRILGDEDEELIVYVAPYPRLADASPVPPVPRVKLPQTSILAGRSLDAPGGLVIPAREDDASPTPASDHGRTMHANPEDRAGASCLSLASLTLGPNISASASASTSTSTPTQRPSTNVALRVHKKVRLQRRCQRQKKQGQMGFRAFGLMMSEARLREEDAKERQHSKWNTRRKGDSDLDWGTEDEDGESEDGEEENRVDAVLDGSEGMGIDPDLDMDVDAMRGFLKSMSAEGTRFVTIDDLEDEARMQQEDEEGKGGPGGSSDSEHSDEEMDAENEDEDEEEEREEELEDKEKFNIEEGILIAESEDDKEVGSSEDSDDELSPASNFKARLLKVRKRSRGQRPETPQEISDDEDDKGVLPTLPSTRTADDKDMLARIQVLLEEHSQIPADHDRKEDTAALRQVHVNEWDVKEQLDDPEFTTPVNKKKGKKGKCKQATGHLAAELQAQWAKDRAKKAERKQQRRAARLLAELDALDPDAVLSFAPTVAVDIQMLEVQIRRFANDKECASMVLPPMDNEMRKLVHEMARVFGMKSVSQGEGDERYTTLFRGSQKPAKVKVKEGKVKALMKRYGGQGKSGRGSGNGKNGNAKEGGRKVKNRDTPKHREGDEVGKEAPKIGQGNIGFKMLASMGWSEGDRIGGMGSVGIEAPLTAIVKHSKLGLGATR